MLVFPAFLLFFTVNSDTIKLQERNLPEVSMRHTYLLILTGLLVTGCANAASEQPAETAVPFPAEEETVTEIMAG